MVSMVNDPVSVGDKSVVPMVDAKDVEDKVRVGPEVVVRVLVRDDVRDGTRKSRVVDVGHRDVEFDTKV